MDKKMEKKIYKKMEKNINDFHDWNGTEHERKESNNRSSTLHKKAKRQKKCKKNFHFFEIKTTSVLYSCNEI